jgi:hypothetical protein
VANLYRGIAFLAVLAIFAAFRICKLQKNRAPGGFDSAASTELVFWKSTVFNVLKSEDFEGFEKPVSGE